MRGIGKNIRKGQANKSHQHQRRLERERERRNGGATTLLVARTQTRGGGAAVAPRNMTHAGDESGQRKDVGVSAGGPRNPPRGPPMPSHPLTAYFNLSRDSSRVHTQGHAAVPLQAEVGEMPARVVCK